jgi:hypothetical protein
MKSLLKICTATILLVFTMAINSAYAQLPEKEKDEDGEKKDDFSLITDTPLTIDLEKEDEEEDDSKKKKKRKKNVYYGLKTKKGYTKSGFGNNVKIEIFHYLKEFKEPDPYVRDIFWYDFKKRQIRNSKGYDKENSGILHGPYKVIQGEQVIEEGIFYIGTKHGRWTRMGKYYDYYVLVDKKKYYQGWPKESRVTYYDKDRTKLKEVIPVEFEKKEGNYFYFHPNGLVAVQGEFENDQKVGKWTEFYQFNRRRKREVQYPDDPYNQEFSPFIIKEWDEKGNLIYDREEKLKRLSSR